MTEDSKTPKSGWSDRELLVSVLYLINKTGSVFNYNDGCYPPGRNANGFKQKLNALKNSLRPEWEAMEAGVPISLDLPPKKPATPRKRKAKTDDAGDAGEVTPKKGRGRPKKKEPTPEVEDDHENIEVKAEKKDEDEDDILKEADAI
ncbi:hypothetical protein G6011_02649 [Alternaria panax]|uniref:Uncharacterized protein n=1 Tax=Alternaria panax TaxID=48097 RepID=A0AAD4FC48_9PLEO|nr:hypothetical protein G6011_02649 [Alternaria panax]